MAGFRQCFPLRRTSGTSRLFLSCTCLTGPLPVATTKQASGLRQEAPCLLSRPRPTSKLGSAFSLHGLRFQNNSRDADLMSSLNNSRIPEADLRASYLLTKSSSCSIAGLTAAHVLHRSGFRMARRRFLFLPLVAGSHLLQSFLQAS